MALTLAEYKLEIDWDNNGGFGSSGFSYWFPFAFYTGVPPGDTLENITDDARDFSWMRGRDAELDKTETGEASITVVDTTGKYIPQNTASPLYDDVKPGRQVYIRAKHLGNIYHLFRGYLDDILPEPHLDERRAVLPCLDGMDKLARDRVHIPLQKWKESGHLFTEALDRIGWDAVRRALDDGQDTYPLVFTEEVFCRYFLDNVSQSEFGFYYVDGRGFLVWEDRHHRLLAPHTVSQWVASADKYINIEPMTSLKSIRNVIAITGQPYTSNAAVVDLWYLAENKDNTPADSRLLRHGETYTYWALFDRIADNVVNPVATTDYLGNDNIDGSGADRTASLSAASTLFAQSAKIQITNNHATDNIYLTMLKIRGELYDKPNRLKMVAEDATSIAEYGERQLLIELHYYPGSLIMQNMADYQLGTKKNPWSRYRITLVGDTDEILTQILARKLSDRITLQNADYNIDDDFYIDKMEHQVGEDSIHRCRWTLNAADTMMYWVWGISRWGVSTRWGY